MEIYTAVSVLVCNGMGSDAASSKNREKPYAVEYIHGRARLAHFCVRIIGANERSGLCQCREADRGEGAARTAQR